MSAGPCRIVAHDVGGGWPVLSPPEAAWRADLDPALGAGAAADRLRLPGAVAITTGQQPGLFGGPMYTLHKAVAAAALAAALERAWQRPVVPVFWLAGDDHDWTEATTTSWWSANEEVVTWALPDRPVSAPQRPMRDELLPTDVAAARARLGADLPPGAARDETLAWIDRHWRSGATVHEAYAGGLGELLERAGVAAFDATSPAVKQAQRPWLRAALTDSDRLDATLATLPDAGTGITAGDGATLVFLEASAGRDRLLRTDTGFRLRRGGEEFTEAELLELLDAEPGRFSANVLLRPVVEAALLPTAAYVAGPGELRYLTGQATALYPLLEVAPQAVVPRWGGTVVDATSSRLLGRLGLEPADVIADAPGLRREVLQRDFPGEATAALAALGEAIDSAAGVLRTVGPAIDPVLSRAVDHRATRLMAVRDDLQHLLERHHSRRGDIALAQYRRLEARLRPLGAPQERVIGIAGMLGRVGWEWIAAARVSADAWAAAHLSGGGNR